MTVVRVEIGEGGKIVSSLATLIICRRQRPKHMKALQLEIPIHASDRVVHHGHAGVSGGLGVLPRKIFIGSFVKVFVTVASLPFFYS